MNNPVYDKVSNSFRVPVVISRGGTFISSSFFQAIADRDLREKTYRVRDTSFRIVKNR